MNNYGRSIEIYIHKANCYVCNTEKNCLITNSSDGEYIDVCICKECIDKLFERPIYSDIELDKNLSNLL